MVATSGSNGSAAETTVIGAQKPDSETLETDCLIADRLLGTNGSLGYRAGQTTTKCVFFSASWKNKEGVISG